MAAGIDDRSPTAKAMSKVSEIMAACLLMIVPALIGIWIDQKFSTVLLFTLLGFGVGMTGAIYQLIRLVSPKNPTDENDSVGKTEN